MKRFGQKSRAITGLANILERVRIPASPPVSCGFIDRFYVGRSVSTLLPKSFGPSVDPMSRQDLTAPGRLFVGTPSSNFAMRSALALIQKLAGHEELAVTQRYICAYPYPRSGEQRSN
jgi:hypothetical protein